MTHLIIFEKKSSASLLLQNQMKRLIIFSNQKLSASLFLQKKSAFFVNK
jgi:hypothetical protein